MLAFDFRLIYNPTRLRLGRLFRKQTMVVGGGGCGAWVTWTSPSPSGSWRCRSWVSWFCFTSSEFGVPASANTQGTRPSHCMEMRCRKTAFPKESIASSVLSRDLGRRTEKMAGKQRACIPQLIHKARMATEWQIQRSIRVDSGEFTGVCCFICLTICPRIHSFLHPSIQPFILLTIHTSIPP